MTSKILAGLAKNGKWLLAALLIAIGASGYFDAEILLEVLYKDFHFIFKVS